MERTLFVNDAILINKMAYGPRLPRSPFDIPLLNILCYFNNRSKNKMNDNWWPYKRLPGTKYVKHGDVMVFNSTWSKDFIIVKRCIALSGDTLKIEGSTISVNRNLIANSKKVVYDYIFKIPNKNTFQRYLESSNLSHIEYDKYDETKYRSTLSLENLEALTKHEVISDVTIEKDSLNRKKLFFETLYDWSYNSMGPIIIPKKNMTITFSKETFALYQHVINNSEDSKIMEIDGVYFIDNKKASQYTFKNDYFFMMGDNRRDTQDSRTWGFVPENNIIGKVECILFSNNKGTFRWNRLFKKVQ